MTSIFQVLFGKKPSDVLSTIPEFPEFKKLELADKEVVEAFTQEFAPYSDFNFTSLWAWDTDDNRMLSKLNGNLVVQFTDYSTSEPFLSYIGSRKLVSTAKTLIKYCQQHNLPQELRLVPEVAIKGLRFSNSFTIKEDRDNFDYICNIHEHASFEGGNYKTKRRRTHKLQRETPGVRSEIVNFFEIRSSEDILSLLSIWEQNKLDREQDYELENELRAITKLLETKESHKLIATCIFDGEKMIAFSMDEILPNHFSLCHFTKADSTHAGIYEHVMQVKSAHFKSLGVNFINYEQDLGLPGLRTNKLGYYPHYFLKKYTISPRKPGI